MMPDFVWRWCVAWLDRQGLAAVAAVLEQRAAKLGNVTAMHAAAKRALVAGDHGSALAAITPALERSPANSGYWCTRGVAHRMALSFTAARADYERAIELDPGNVLALSNLGEWHLAQGTVGEALGWIDAALAVDPSYFEARANHVAALIELGRFEQARSEAEALVASEPHRPESYGNLGNVLINTGKWRDAVKQFKHALKLRPDYAEAHFNLAVMLGSPDNQQMTVNYLERQIKEKGETNNRLNLLAAAHLASGDIERAETLCRRVIERQPDSLGAHITWATCISKSGNAIGALPAFERVLKLDDSQMAMASTLVFELNYLAEYSREEIFRRHLAWAQRYEGPLLSRPALCKVAERDPTRKLKIGYVSGDLCAHPVGFLLRDIMGNHDRNSFETHCFSLRMRPDEVTADIRAASDHWREVAFDSEDELAAAIADEGIDLLVDLSGHTALNRLMVFARRPAPVQATWLGYFHSTGMSSMDYFITDPYTSPSDSGQLFSERAIHLPHTRFCFSPPAYAPQVVPPPENCTGVVTFGSFNRLPKLTEQVISTWAKILLAVPTSKLILKSEALSDHSVHSRFIDRLVSRGIDSQRLDLRGASPHRDMLAEYGEIDIALDPFPFNGGMTTLEALWMGVPVLTLEGDTVVSRQTHSVLVNLNLAAELSFTTLDGYVAGAVRLANCPVRLAELRNQIRGLMTASPLLQCKQFTRDLEEVYRRMWQAWCNGTPLCSDVRMSLADGEQASSGGQVISPVQVRTGISQP